MDTRAMRIFRFGDPTRRTQSCRRTTHVLLDGKYPGWRPARAIPGRETPFLTEQESSRGSCIGGRLPWEPPERGPYAPLNSAWLECLTVDDHSLGRASDRQTLGRHQDVPGSNLGGGTKTLNSMKRRKTASWTLTRSVPVNTGNAWVEPNLRGPIHCMTCPPTARSMPRPWNVTQREQPYGKHGRRALG